MHTLVLVLQYVKPYDVRSSSFFIILSFLTNSLFVLWSVRYVFKDRTAYNLNLSVKCYFYLAE